jgi:ketosteroid isomerase-like protein
MNMFRIAVAPLVAVGAALGLGGLAGKPAAAGTNLGSQAASTSAEIDAQVWAPASAAVAGHDIAALGRTYHGAAVLVSTTGTQPIAKALDGWGKDMVTAKQAGTRAAVAFRFSKRQDGAETAFESGIFRYATTTRAGITTPTYTHFEALLIRNGGRWLFLMERQLGAATEKEWDALPH